MVPSARETKKTPGLVGLHTPEIAYECDGAELKRGPVYCKWIISPLLTESFSFQIWKDHPPTLKRISEKNGERRRSLIEPKWQLYACSTREATRVRFLCLQTLCLFIPLTLSGPICLNQITFLRVKWFFSVNYLCSSEKFRSHQLSRYFGLDIQIVFFHQVFVIKHLRDPLLSDMSESALTAIFIKP
jgi:hypothetical protein